MKYTRTEPKKLIPFDPPLFTRGNYLPENWKYDAYKERKTSEFENLTNRKIEKNGTCRRILAFINQICEYFEELYLISIVKLDDVQVTFYLLLWKNISITPYVK